MWIVRYKLICFDSELIREYDKSYQSTRLYSYQAAVKVVRQCVNLYGKNCHSMVIRYVTP